MDRRTSDPTWSSPRGGDREMSRTQPTIKMSRSRSAPLTAGPSSWRRVRRFLAPARHEDSRDYKETQLDKVRQAADRGPRMDTVKRFYPVSEVAARFEVTSQTVRNWIASGRLPSVQPTPGGRYRIPIDALARFERDSGLLPKDALPSPNETAREGASGRRVQRQRQSGRSRPGDRGRKPAAGPDANIRAGNQLSGAVAAELRLVVDAIATSIRPEAVILFGSRARGDARARDPNRIT